MEGYPDFKELLGLFNEKKVEYLIVGGHALAFHGAPRFTGDIDILVEPSTKNAERILRALDEFGFGSVGLTEEDFQSSDEVVQLGVPPMRVDIITSITGVAVEDAFAGGVDGKYGDIPVRYLGREQLVLNKRKTGRKKDLADLEAVGEE